MPYSKKVIEHFRNPHNQGIIKNADAVGKVGNPVCGDVMKIYLKIDNRQSDCSPREAGAGRRANSKQQGFVIKDIKFETLGCAAAIAVSSVLTDMVKGKTLDQSLKITKDQIVNDLGGLPPIKIHCSMLGVEALHQAIRNYQDKIK